MIIYMNRKGIGLITDSPLWETKTQTQYGFFFDEIQREIKMWYESDSDKIVQDAHKLRKYLMRSGTWGITPSNIPKLEEI